MAPAQKNVELCDQPIDTQIKLRLLKDGNKVKNGVYDNNNTVVINGDSDMNADPDFDIMKYEAMEFTAKIRWPDTFAQLSLHLCTLYGVFLILTNQVKLYTILFGKFFI